MQTRSPLVARYFDLIAAIPTAVLNLTIETDNDEIRRQLTPSCPTIERRLAVVRAATARGIYTQITVSPALPHEPERFAALIAGSCRAVQTNGAARAASVAPGQNVIQNNTK